MDRPIANGLSMLTVSNLAQSVQNARILGAEKICYLKACFTNWKQASQSFRHAFKGENIMRGYASTSRMLLRGYEAAFRNQELNVSTSVARYFERYSAYS